MINLKQIQFYNRLNKLIVESELSPTTLFFIIKTVENDLKDSINQCLIQEQQQLIQTNEEINKPQEKEESSGQE